jgi:hypothetical protein
VAAVLVEKYFPRKFSESAGIFHRESHGLVMSDYFPFIRLSIAYLSGDGRVREFRGGVRYSAVIAGRSCVRDPLYRYSPLRRTESWRSR